MIRMQHGARALGIQHTSGQINAPVVDGHRHIEQPFVDAGEVEIEEAAEALRVAIGCRLE